MIKMSERDWIAKSRCRGEDTSQFFPSGSQDALARLTAQTYCAQCSVRKKCHAYGIEIQAMDGIWGGVLFGQTRSRRAKYRKIIDE